jgi:NAD(P)-dependent dehydrogenase (short-subunit alcohol dehydrogenase family)
MTDSIVVTGASAGLGLAASRELARAGYHVILGCRSVSRGEAARAAIRTSVPDARLEVVEMDLASLASVRSAAKKVTENQSRVPLHGIVCNAGVQVVSGLRRSRDGYELTFATNHLGHFELINLLLGHVGAGGRITLVSSQVHQGPRKAMGFPAPRWEHPTKLADPAKSAVDGGAHAGRVRYATSKLANLYTTYELARRVQGRGITVNAFDPGLMPATGLDRDWPQWTQFGYHAMAPVLVRLLPGARSVDRSAADLAWLMSAPEVARVTGGYFSGRRRHSSSAESYDRLRAAELWEVSAQLVAAIR